MADAACGHLAIQFLNASKVDAVHSVIVYYPISKKNEPGGDSLLPGIRINSRDECGPVFKLHSTGALGQKDDADISCSCKLLECRNQELEDL